jgi:predicted membrane protein
MDDDAKGPSRENNQLLMILSDVTLLHSLAIFVIWYLVISKEPHSWCLIVLVISDKDIIGTDIQDLVTVLVVKRGHANTVNTNSIIFRAICFKTCLTLGQPQ